MNIPDEAEKRFPYDYAREGDRFTAQQAFIEGAEWARNEAFREAAETARTTPLTLDDIGYEAQVIAEAILGLAEGGE